MKLAAWLCLGLLCLGMTACAASTDYGPPLTTEEPPAAHTPAELEPEPDQEQTITLTEPPVLTVSAGAVSIKATRGAISWRYDSGDGTWCDLEADSVHPLDEISREFLPQLCYEDRAAALTFAVEPDTVELTGWHAAHWGNTGAEGQTLPVEDGAFTLSLGPGLYEVKAQWTGADTYSGTAYYAFYAAPAEEAPLICVESGGVTAVPYPVLTWSEIWTEDGCLCVDCGLLDLDLGQLVQAGSVPALVLDGALSWEAQASVTVGRVQLCDADGTTVADTTWADLENLEPGTYYISVEAAVLEQFIPAAESYDCSGYVFNFQLTVPDGPTPAA